MKIGFPQELLAFAWVAQLKEKLEAVAAGIEWVHAPRPGKAGVIMLSEGDACFPFKKMVRTAVALLPEVDRLFIPRLVRLDGHLFCPNFRALPDIVVLNRDRLPGGPVLTPVIDTVVDAGNQREEKAVFEKIVNELLGFSSDSVFDGKGKIEAEFAEQRIGVAAAEETAGDKKTIALIGRSYMLADPLLNMGIADILRDQGYRVITPRDVPFAELDRLAARHDYFAKTLYWRGARETLGAYIHFTENCAPAGIIYLLSFNCGVDALLRIELQSLHKKSAKKIPFMVLVGDEHTQREHIVTRMEAFLDVINGITNN